MSVFSNMIKVFLTGILLILATNLYAQEANTTDTTTTSTVETSTGPVTVQKRVIITTTVPAPKQTYEIPTGYVSCTTVPAAWVDDKWIPEHKVCTYKDSAQGAAWIDGYWSCADYKSDTGECTNWVWVAAHWVKTYSAY
jgi:hypothetical protein